MAADMGVPHAARLARRTCVSVLKGCTEDGTRGPGGAKFEFCQCFWRSLGNSATVNGAPGPSSYDDGGAALIDELQDAKTVIYRSIVEEAAVARPGVLALMDAAIAAPGIAVGICSAATRGGFEKITDAVVGPERLGALDVVIAGDDVERKKPDPQIYDLARARLGGLDSAKCVVIEDSLVGLRAAKGAGMACAITYTPSTAAEDFFGEGADAVLADLGGVTLADLFGASTGAEAGALFAGLSDAQRKPAS